MSVAHPDAWSRYRDLIAVQHRILVGKSTEPLERLAQVYASDKRPVIRMYSEKTVADLFTQYGKAVLLKTASVVGRSYDALIKAREGKPEPRKWADHMVKAVTWKDIAARVQGGASVAQLAEFYTTKFTVKES